MLVISRIKWVEIIFKGNTGINLGRNSLNSDKVFTSFNFGILFRMISPCNVWAEFELNQKNESINDEIMTVNEQPNNTYITKCADMHSMWDLAFCMTAKIKPRDIDFDSKLFQILSQSKYFKNILLSSKDTSGYHTSAMMKSIIL